MTPFFHVPNHSRIKRRSLWRGAPAPAADQAQIVMAGALDQAVHNVEAELPRFGFNVLPIDRDLHRVAVEILEERPDSFHGPGPAAGIVDLRAQLDEGLAVHFESVFAALADETRHRRSNQRSCREEKAKHCTHLNEVLRS